MMSFNQFQHSFNNPIPVPSMHCIGSFGNRLIPDHDITFDDIGVCPIDDHHTYGVEAGTSMSSIDSIVNSYCTNNNVPTLSFI